MSFEDVDLAAAMEDYLLDAEVMDWSQLWKLLADPSAANISATLSSQQLGHFGNYWASLGTWMQDQGGDIASTSGQQVPGRVHDEVPSEAETVLYDNAFASVNATIGQPDFQPVEAVRSQLLFAKALGPQPADTSQLPPQPATGDRHEQ